MKKIGLFYGTATAKTAAVAKKIKEAFGEDIVDIIPVEQSDEKEFNAYEYIIAGSSTWFDGELPTYWDETLPELTGLDLTGKKVALFGLGDQKKYPDNFADGIGHFSKSLHRPGSHPGWKDVAGRIPFQPIRCTAKRAIPRIDTGHREPVR